MRDSHPSRSNAFSSVAVDSDWQTWFIAFDSGMSLLARPRVQRREVQAGLVFAYSGPTVGVLIYTRLSFCTAVSTHPFAGGPGVALRGMAPTIPEIFKRQTVLLSGHKNSSAGSGDRYWTSGGVGHRTENRQTQ